MARGLVAALDLPVVVGGDLADARPAVLLHGREVLHAGDVGRRVLALLAGGLVADVEG